MVNRQRLTFPKSERLVSRGLIETLFAGGGSSMVTFPLRVIFIKKERARGDAPVQVLISVPKKRFRHAVDRNRVKRQIREAYRQHQQLLYGALPENCRLLLAFVWLSDRHVATAKIDHCVRGLLRRTAEKL